MRAWACCILLATGGFRLRAVPLEEAGRYLTRIAGCIDCHTSNIHEPFAGGYRLATPFGVFVTPNITPDRQTGIGAWTEEDFRDALRYGERPQGGLYYPAFPYPSYSNLSDEDIRAIFAYLKSLPPIHKKDRPSQLNFPYSQRWLMHFWQLLFFSHGPYRLEPKRSLTWNHGAYLVKAALHCAECHTPRDEMGALKTSLWLAGSQDPLTGQVIPNITPDPQTGLGHWSAEDWSRFLASGLRPDETTPGTEMAQVLQNTSALTPQDRAAVVEYLTSLKPIHREPGHDP